MFLLFVPLLSLWLSYSVSKLFFSNVRNTINRITIAMRHRSANMLHSSNQLLQVIDSSMHILLSGNSFDTSVEETVNNSLGFKVFPSVRKMLNRISIAMGYSSVYRFHSSNQLLQVIDSSTQILLLQSSWCYHGRDSEQLLRVQGHSPALYCFVMLMLSVPGSKKLAYSRMVDHEALAQAPWLQQCILTE
jgi:hypothetical protein